MFQNLRPVEYDIAGNVLRAWYDDEGKLAFVVDETIDEYKPNVLLVVRSDGTRRLVQYARPCGMHGRTLAHPGPRGRSDRRTERRESESERH